MTQSRNERYVRWQDYRINHLSFSINLFLSFSVASIALLISMLLKDLKGNEIGELVLTIWAYSAIAGCLATIFRLLDFRYTSRKIRKRTCVNAFVARHVGKLTWSMFWSQVILYSCGAYFFIYGVVLA
ncbi:hypothetical protein [Agarivorans albus]|uniref:hypothetical protein n=1 Tax=Agarivorans albus TaxID=182262 RepID=UPI001BFE711B|nr:hypothetical protein [Agarivorans albus]